MTVSRIEGEDTKVVTLSLGAGFTVGTVELRIFAADRVTETVSSIVDETSVVTVELCDAVLTVGAVGLTGWSVKVGSSNGEATKVVVFSCEAGFDAEPAV